MLSFTYCYIKVKCYKKIVHTQQEQQRSCRTRKQRSKRILHVYSPGCCDAAHKARRYSAAATALLLLQLALLLQLMLVKPFPINTACINKNYRF